MYDDVLVPTGRRETINSAAIAPGIDFSDLEGIDRLFRPSVPDLVSEEAGVPALVVE